MCNNENKNNHNRHGWYGRMENVHVKSNFSIVAVKKTSKNFECLQAIVRLTYHKVNIR